MNLENIGPEISPRFMDPSAPPRELNIHGSDEAIIDEAIDKLEESSLKTEELFGVFDDWQTKKTITSKRIFVSASTLVASAAWVGIDYNDLTFFGLKVSNGSPDRFLIFILLSIMVSGIFYEFSRRIDTSVRNARIKHIDSDLKELEKPIEAIDEAMSRNGIESFGDLYYDFRSSLSSGSHDAIDVYNAINFYKNNLRKASLGLMIVNFMEHLAIYSISVFAVAALVFQLVQVDT